MVLVKTIRPNSISGPSCESDHDRSRTLARTRLSNQAMQTLEEVLSIKEAGTPKDVQYPIRIGVFSEFKDELTRAILKPSASGLPSLDLKWVMNRIVKQFRTYYSLQFEFSEPANAWTVWVSLSDKFRGEISSTKAPNIFNGFSK